MFSNADIRAQARETIRTQGGMLSLAILPVGLTLLVNLIQLGSQSPAAIVQQISDNQSLLRYLGTVLSFAFFYRLLLALMGLSILLTLFQFISGKKDQFGFKSSLEIFSSPHFGKILWTSLLKQIFLFLWGGLAILGFAIFISSFGLAAAFLSEAGIHAADAIPEDLALTITLLFLLGIVLMIAGYAMYLPNYYAYSQVEFLLFDQLETGTYQGAAAIVKESRYMMRGYKGQRFLLDLSFIGWFFLYSLSFGLAGIYVLPYYSAAQVHFYKKLKPIVEAEKEAYLQFLQGYLQRQQ